MTGIKGKLKDRLHEAMVSMNKKSVDLVNDLGIPKSAMSQYLSGKSQNMDSKRLYSIAKYLNVSEAWLMGYDVPKEKTATQKNNDIMADIIVRMRTDADFLSVVELLNNLDSDQLASVKQMLKAFNKDS